MAVNLTCPNCHETFGKDTENPQWVNCGNCGEMEIYNERGYDEEEDDD